MLEISASASLKAEAAAKNKELAYQIKREMSKRYRVRRKHPKTKRVVVEQKLVELIRMIRMCKRVKAEATDLFEKAPTTTSAKTNNSKCATTHKLRVVSLALESFLNSFMFVQPSDHEYIFQLVRPISESCTLSIPSLASLVSEAKNVLPFVNINLPELLYNNLPPIVPSKFYGFSEILKASEIFGDVIRFLLNSSTHITPLSANDPEQPLPSFSVDLAHSSAAISLAMDKFTTPFTWKSYGLSTNIEVRGMVSCVLSNNFIVSITIHFDPFSIVRQSVPVACDILLRVDDKNSLFTGNYEL
jgi:hypothetical protein